MFLDKIPLELLVNIAEYLPPKDVAEFSKTCKRCYYAILPLVWQQLSLHDPAELNLLAKRLKHNVIWAERANFYVRNIALTNGKEADRKYNPLVAASMFGIPSDQSLNKTIEKRTPNERIGRFGKKLLKMFPQVSNLVFDFRESVKNFRFSDTLNETNSQEVSTDAAQEEQTLEHTTEYVNTPAEDDEEEEDQDDNTRLPYSGSVSLINYKSDSSQFMHYMLSPFRTSQHVKLQASPVMSVCDDIDESILTDQDLSDLANLGLMDLKKLELAYLDSNIKLGTLKTLIQNLPSIQELDIEWLFKPNKYEFQEICDLFKAFGSLAPTTVYTTERNIFHASFTRI